LRLRLHRTWHSTSQQRKWQVKPKNNTNEGYQRFQVTIAQCPGVI
jgi:hypothetical protein